MRSEPFVSIVTPVYNEAEYLGECIESVLAQTYQNWDYTIVDNCSTDKSFDIAQSYAKRDSRIRVSRNEKFVCAIENHNIAFRQISPDSVYCKLLSGDDWLYPEYLSKSIALAEQYPTIGVVASYSINTEFGFRWPKLDPTKTIFDGRDVCRWFLLGMVDSFFAPSVVLYRSSLVRGEYAFFPGTARSADLSACLNCLMKSDLGFIHQVLSFERIHENSDTAVMRKMDSYLLDWIRILNDFAPQCLQPKQHEHRLDLLLTEYYENVLAVGVFNFRERAFWRLHKARLQELGYPFYCSRLFKAAAKKAADLVFNPKQTAEKLLRRVRSARKRKLDAPVETGSVLHAEASCPKEPFRAGQR
jgi:glycosyltransferase involved in cell wall biosynthesis